MSEGLILHSPAVDAFYLRILWQVLAVSGFLLCLWILAVARSEAPPKGASKASTRLRGASKGLVFVLGLFLLLAGGYGLWRTASLRSDLNVLTGLSAEELRVFRDLARDFEREHGVRVNVENRDWQLVLPRERAPNTEELERYDLITWDINWRHELLQSGIIQDLNEIEQRYKELPPSSINPVVIDYLREGGTLYFLPYRLDVQVLFGNNEMLRLIEDWCDAYLEYRRTKEPSGTSRVFPLFISIEHRSLSALLEPERDFVEQRCNAWSHLRQGKAESEKQAIRLPRTWNQVMDLARFAWTIDRKPREPRVVIAAGEEDKALFLIQLLRSAGLENVSCVSDPKAREAFEWLSEIYPFVNPEGDEKSSRANWRTVGGFLLSGSVIVARNWAYTLSLLHTSGRESEFLLGSGLSLDGEFDPSNLLGGELLALPKRAPNKERAIQLMKFLLSKETQTIVVTELTWPAMRMDVEGKLYPWQKRYQQVLKAALLHARPTPESWSRQVADIYEQLFDEIVDRTSPPDEDELRNRERQIRSASAVEVRCNGDSAGADPAASEDYVEPIGRKPGRG